MIRCTDCENSVSISRRGFLKASAILSFAALPDFAFGAANRRTRLVVILMRGGMDGLFAAPPFGDPSIASLRKHIQPDHYQKLDSFFSLHPVLGTINDLYRKGQALLVHGVSFPYTGRSHFEGQDIMESGIMRAYASPTGWLGRGMDASGFTPVAMSLPIPLILRGQREVANRYPSWINKPDSSYYKSILPMWTGDPDLAPVGEKIEASLADRAGMSAQIYIGDRASFVSLAADAGQRLKLDDGPRVAVLDYVGFDTHSGQPGQQSEKLGDVDAAIGLLRQNLGPVWNDTLVVTVTEFGRTAAENGSYGTDHGWGSAIIVVGGRLKKSGIVADWPGLKKSALFEGRDVKATIDARSVYGAVLSAALELDPERIKKDVLDYKPSPLIDSYI